MKHLILKALVVVVMITMVFTTNSYAGFWFHGKVTDRNGSPISGATIQCTNCSPSLSTQSDSDGEYVLPYHNYCDRKYLSAFGEDWEKVTKSVYDGSCPECSGVPSDQCDYSRRVSFILDPADNPDIDGDGRLNVADNCPTVPNWLGLGTCTDGKKGNVCSNHAQCKKCGVPGYCSKLQEDCDGDGVGDACDTCVTQPDGCSNCNNTTALSELNPAHKLMSSQLVTQMDDDDSRTMWYIIISLWIQGHNSSSYPTHLQGLIGMFNGPDKLCGECVHDFNENGICDEEEEGGVPIWITPKQYLESLINAYQYCLTEKLPNCDPEEDPFSCMW